MIQYQLSTTDYNLTLVTWKIDNTDSLTVKPMNSQLSLCIFRILLHICVNSGTDYNIGLHGNELQCRQQQVS